jgi:hypothetical protein
VGYEESPVQLGQMHDSVRQFDSAAPAHVQDRRYHAPSLHVSQYPIGVFKSATGNEARQLRPNAQPGNASLCPWYCFLGKST